MKNKCFLRLACVLLAALMLSFLLAACGKEKPYELHFKNGLSAKLHQIFISPSDSETWGGEDNLINLADVGAGSTIGFDFSKFGGTDGGTYDIGTIDENGMNYDCYEVVLKTGDEISLVPSGDGAIFTVTHQDGTYVDVEADVYPNE